MGRCILVALIGALMAGCSALTIARAPKAVPERALMRADDARNREAVMQRFGEPVETVRYASPVVARRDLYEFPAGIRYRPLYAALSLSAAVFTLGASELFVLPAAAHAARATAALRVYFSPDDSIYGAVVYRPDLGMWFLSELEADAGFASGFPCYDFPAPMRRAMASRLARQGAPELAARLSNCLRLERQQTAGQ